jgi:hypothetical protein
MAAGENLDTFVSTVSMKLQLLSQDLNSELEKGEQRGFVLLGLAGMSTLIHMSTPRSSYAAMMQA